MHSPHCAKCKRRAGESLRLRVTLFSDERDKTTGLWRLRLEGGGILEVMKPFCMLTAVVFTHYVIFFFFLMFTRYIIIKMGKKCTPTKGEFCNM